MKNCEKCGAAIDDNAAVCPVCGADQPACTNAVSDGQVLESMAKFLRYERIAWRVGGIVFLVCGVIFAVCGIALFVLGAVYGDQPFRDYAPILPVFAALIAGTAYLSVGLIAFIPVGIIDLIMVKKVKYYLDTLHTDVSIARKRCTSVGMIVFGALFNNIALIFIIINFVKTRTRSAAFDRIEAAQKK